MKRLFSLFLALTILFSFVACNNPADTEATESGVQVDENLITVDITLNASFFEEMTDEEIISNASENDYINCVIHPDGSVTYTMTKAKHKEALNEMKLSFEESIQELLSGENKVASFTAIDYNEDFSCINIYVDSSLYSMWDNIYVLMFYISGVYYQAFAGVPNDEIDIIVNFIDSNTKETLNSSSYQEYISNMSES